MNDYIPYNSLTMPEPIKIRDKNMKVQYISDLHLEFGDMFMPRTVGDVLVLAGDIAVGINAVEWINEAAESFKDVIYILGNHEFYHNDMPKLITDLRAPGLFAPNVHFLDNECITIEGVKFAATTLWAMVNKTAFYSMNDSNYIKYAYRYLTVGKVHGMFAEAKEFLLDSDADVIITHHCPSIKSINTSRYPNDLMNSGYYTDILADFEGHRVKHWICGHTHSSTKYEDQGIKVYNNCRGYVGRGKGPQGCEVADFNPEEYFEVC